MAELSPSSLVGALFKKSNVAKAQKYSPIALWKSWGYFDLNVSKSMREIIVGDSKPAQKIRNASLWLAQTAGNFTWGTLWNACEIEIKRKNPDLKPGSEAFDKAVGELLSRVIDRTQVVDSVFHRSQLMRSESGLVKLYTAFMAEPTKSYNMLRNAVMAMARKEKGAGKKLVRVAVTFLLTQAANAAARAFIQAFRMAGADEDEDGEEDKWGIRWIRSFGEELANNVNPLSLIPGGRDIVSMIQGYNAQRMDFKAVETLYSTVIGLWKYVNGESKWSGYKLGYKIAEAVSYLTGIPMANLMREFKSVYDAISEENISMESDTSTLKNSIESLYKATLAGDTAKVKRIREALLNDKDNPRSPADIDKALAKMLMEKDPRIAEAYEARASQNHKKLIQITNTIKVDGFSHDVVVYAINQYENSLKGWKDKNLSEELDAPLYDYDDLFGAISAGVDDETILKIRDEIIAHSRAKNPAESVRNEVVGKFKPEYIDAVNAGDRAKADALAKKLRLFDVTDEKMTQWVLDNQSAQMKEALTAGDIAEANKYIDSQRWLGRDDDSIKSIVTLVEKKLVIEAYEQYGWAGVDRYVGLLSSVDLYNTNKKSRYYGQPYYYRNMIYGWVEDYLEELRTAG